METGEDDGIGRGTLSEQRAVDVEGDAGQELENGAGWQGEGGAGLTRSWNWTVYEKLGSGKARVVFEATIVFSRTPLVEFPEPELLLRRVVSATGTPRRETATLSLVNVLLSRDTWRGTT